MAPPDRQHADARSEYRERRQIETGVFLVDGGESAVLRVDEEPRIDPLAQLEILMRHDRRVVGRGYVELGLDLLVGIAVRYGLARERRHRDHVDLAREQRLDGG